MTGRLITLGDVAARVRLDLAERQPGDSDLDANRRAVRDLLISRPGITQTQIANRLKMSGLAVGRHVKAIRVEWEAREE
jgi:hypothetical protein